MLYWALVFFIISIIAAVFGFGGIAAAAAGIAKIPYFCWVGRVAHVNNAQPNARRSYIPIVSINIDTKGFICSRQGANLSWAVGVGHINYVKTA